MIRILLNIGAIGFRMFGIGASRADQEAAEVQITLCEGVGRLLLS